MLNIIQADQATSRLEANTALARPKLGSHEAQNNTTFYRQLSHAAFLLSQSHPVFDDFKLFQIRKYSNSNRIYLLLNKHCYQSLNKYNNIIIANNDFNKPRQCNFCYNINSHREALTTEPCSLIIQKTNKILRAVQKVSQAVN